MPSIAPNGKSQYGRGLAEGSWKGMKKYLEQEIVNVNENLSQVLTNI